MSSYDPYDAPVRERERTSKRYYREERREDRDPRYEPRDGYLSPVSHDLVPRAREDSDLSVEEIRRDFPPPGYSSRDIRRARSAGGGGYYDDYYDDRRSHYDRDRDYEPRSSRKSESYYYEEEQKKKARVLSKQEQIIAAITGAAIAIGGKELYDRRDAKLHDSEVQRNMLVSAALGAAGAVAGYSGTELYNKHREKEEKKSGALTHRGRGYYSDDEEDGKEKKSSKNFLEGALAAAGLGGAVKALTGGSTKDDKSDTRSRGGSDAGSKGKGEGANKIQKAAMASLIAGATEAFRVSKEPGGWKGEKAKRILTAAAGAATIDAAQKDGGSKLGLAESVIGGLVGNRVINGSKKNIEEDEKTGRSRSRSRARSKSRDGSGGGGGVSGLAALATAGLGAFGAKKIMDNRDESRSRRRSADSNDSRGGSPKRHRSRSRSVVDKARRGLAKLGLGNGPEEEDDRESGRRDRSRRDYDDYEDHKSSRRRRDSYDDYDRDYDRDRDRDHRKSGRRDDYSDDERSHHRRDRSRQRSERGAVARRGSASSTDLGDTDEDERHGKKMKGKQIITTGLATVATIHAAANVYQSMEKRKKRQKAVKEGRLSPEEAKKLKTKAMWQDAASVGIAALGIKSAISEMKEVREVSHEVKEWGEKKEERRLRRRDRLRRRLSELRNGGGSSSSSSSSESSSDEGGRRNRGYLRQRADNWLSAGPPKADRHGDGPRYSDGNPYAALPPPPGGRSDRG